MDTVDQQFRNALEARGIVAPDVIVGDGRLHRCDAVGRNGKGDAVYLIHLDDHPAGGFENHKDGAGWQSWRADVGRMTFEQREELRARVAAATLVRQRQAEQRYKDGCAMAAKVWRRTAKCHLDHDHPYLKRKRVFAFGLGYSGDRLVVPVRAGQQITSVQYIAPDGQKRFLTGATVAGSYHAIGAPDARIYIAEGYATGATVHMATGDAVAVAFDCGNLMPVARRLRDMFPDMGLILCADDDESGIGEEKATEAADAVGGRVVLPVAYAEGTDFNDMAAQLGLAAVAEAVQ